MKQLVINHKLYGKVKITEPVLIELITSPALRRLKGIEQHGTWPLHQSFKPAYRFSRYTHSVGVMLLLRRFNAPIEEQLHGLLHDVSHTVFSHVADFLFGKDPSKHDYQDNRLAKAFRLQGISKILIKHGFSPTRILSTKTFPLAEKQLPDLCADRIDYTLADPWAKIFYTTDPKKILNNLTVHKNQFVFKDQHWAKEFGQLYEQHNINNWCNPTQIAIYVLSAQMLREALRKKVIVKQELYKTDDYVLKKLRASKNKIVAARMKAIKNLKVKVVNQQHADFWSTSKPRSVDPYFLKNGKLVRLSGVDPAYKKRVTVWAKKVKKGFYLKILNS